MAFNDGFYYEDKDDVQFDKDVLISYWSKGWSIQSTSFYQIS
ncbi:beta-N-acetylhexosaminidase [Streptococcus pneumoniae]|nr:beta-N-acetylhexosaminidase [Streptococcus pneumoniae]